jgi:hypothetical protein
LELNLSGSREFQNQTNPAIKTLKLSHCQKFDDSSPIVLDQEMNNTIGESLKLAALFDEFFIL